LVHTLPPGTSDEEVWEFAKHERLPVLTMNAADYRGLTEGAGDHHGLILVYRDNDPTKDMTFADIAAVISKIDARFAGRLRGRIIIANEFRQSGRGAGSR
jgi:uncharacterized protein DUF5615